MSRHTFKFKKNLQFKDFQIQRKTFKFKKLKKGGEFREIRHFLCLVTDGHTSILNMGKIYLGKSGKGGGTGGFKIVNQTTYLHKPRSDHPRHQQTRTVLPKLINFQKTDQLPQLYINYGVETGLL
ncbi:unnamed protein product [Nesidiocoris tenuis]|uniref:Uncharacterized protein n=1 Tax=Nesidiocoris tenuis TaxID=355587 RepID=A0A6H5G5X9_9HEMI|nr:unnamed protein product [Nesidiocoris tenuis]